MSFGFGFGLPRAPLRGRPLVAAIRSLFAANEPGVWYDPSDLSTLYQDAAGTTPVTAVEQPVGLMLDKSKGLTLGPELVTNGDFSDGLAGWSQTGTTWSPAGGTAKNDGTAGYLYKESIVTVGAWVVVECTVADKGTAGSLSISLNNGGATASFSSASLVNGQRVSVRGVKTLNGNVYFFGQGGWNGAIDNISIRELPGNHAYQTTATSRPVLSARYNLLTKTEQFDDAVWAKSNATVTANAVVAPDGTVSADYLQEDTATNTHQVRTAISVSNATVYTFSAYLKAGNRTWAAFTFSNPNAGVDFNLSSGTVGNTSGSITATITNVGNGWYRCTATFTTTDVTLVARIRASLANQVSYTGDGTSGIYIWGADLRVANDGANLPPYQRVNTATDYDTVGFPHYLRFDGVDDWMVTNTITPGTDKAQVFAGVRKLSSAASVIAELSSSYVNSGAFGVFCEGSPGAINNYEFGSKGTILRQVIASPFAAPITNALTAIGDISGDRATLRINGTQAAQNTSDQGTGNYLDYPLYIGRRGGTTLPFNGHLYSLIVRFGSNLPAATIEQTEKYINQKTRAY